MSASNNTRDRLLHVMHRVTSVFLVRGTGAVGSFVLTYFLIKVAGAERFGAFSFALLTSGIFVTFGMLGIDSSLLRLSLRAMGRDRPAIAARHVREIYALGITLAACTALIYVAISLLLMCFERYADIGHSMLMLAPVVVLSSLCRLASNVLRARRRDAGSQLLDGATVMVGLAIVVAITFYASINIAPYVEYAYVALFLLLGVYAFRVHPFDPVHAFRLGYRFLTNGRLRSIRLAAPAQTANAANMLADWLCLLSVMVFCPLVDVAVFRLVLQFGAIFSLIGMAVEIPFASTVALAHSRADRDFVQRMQRIARLLLVGSSGLVVIPILVGAPLLIAKFGLQANEGAFALRVVAIAYFLRSFAGASASTLSVMNLPRQLLHASLLSLAVSLMASFALTAYFGIYGAAVGLALAICSRALFNQFYLSQALR